MTTASPLTWSDRAFESIGKLAARPWSLLLVLLALNALARPYAGITQDARLASAQVLNQLQPGSYADDLFFRYGSQDQFSVFSQFAAPLAGLVGLEAAFFLLYLVFNSLLIIALTRLVEALIEDRLVTTLALVFMMVVPLNFGGLKSLHVLEPFLTSQLMASAFVLFGLERTVRGSYFPALGLMVLALAFHPLVASGGFLIWAACWAWNLLPAKVLAVVAAVVGLTGILVLKTPSVAARIFGTMDEPWREVILRAGPFNFISEWKPADWLNVVMGLIGVGAAAYSSWHTRARQGRFLAVVTMVSVAAVVATGIAESLPYALLLQGQPYRALWILKVLQIPFAFWFAARLLTVPQWYGPLGAVVLLGVLALTTDSPFEVCFPLFVLPVLLLRYRGLVPIPHVPDWWRRGLVLSLVLGFVGWALYKLTLLLANGPLLLQRMDTLEYGRLLIESIGPVGWLLLFAWFATWAARRSGFARGFQGALLALLLLVQGGMALLLASPSFRENHTRYGRDIRFVQDFLRRRHAPAMPTLYSCLGRLDLVWLDLHAKSYFDWWQMEGVMFQRQAAIEGQRRARVVGPFELERFRDVGAVPEITRLQMERFFAADLDTAQPDLDHLKRLCQEPGLDFLLLTHEFPGLVAAGNGRIFLYDCRHLHAELIVSAHAGQIASSSALPRGPLSPGSE